MIYRSRNNIPAPHALDPTNANANNERARAILHYSANPPNTKNINFSCYSDDSVKDVLNILFGAKCAYCEGVLKGLQPMDIEHFRQKGGIVDIHGNKIFPGYWWLASSWINLLPSCIDCNRSRFHQQVGKPKQKFGKENAFPLFPGCSHARVPGGEANELPLLIDPSQENPDAHIAFDFQACGPSGHSSIALPTRSSTGLIDQKGEMSIKVCGLNRYPLVEERAKRVLLLETNLVSIEDRWFLAKSHEESVLTAMIITQCRKDLRNAIRQYLHWKSPYSAACKFVFEQWKAELQQKAAAKGVRCPI